MKQPSSPVNRGNPLAAAYRADTYLLTARRAPIAAAFILVSSAVGFSIDCIYHPERAAMWALGYASCVLVCVAQLVLARRRPVLSVAVSQGVLSYVAVGLSVVYGVFHLRTELLVLILALLMTGTAAFFPWGVRGQVGVSISSLAGYSLALALGAIPMLPVPYEMFELVLAAGVAGMAANVLDKYRFASFQQQEETRRANQFKSEFVSVISHELRTPLSIIVGYTELLLDDTGSGSKDDQREMLQRIHQQSMQLLDLIQAMFDLNRLETRQLSFHIEPFSLGDLMSSLRTNLPANWIKNGVAVQWNVRDEHVVLRSDRGKVQMILRNLIHNALKYTDSGSVTISAEVAHPDGRVVVSVADMGPGIASADQSTIFEMFRQGGNGPRGGGVGLGLHIVKRLTEALDGEVRLQSREGEGARFVVSLPLEARHPE